MTRRDRIAVLSDTHDSLPDRLLDRLAEASEVWHLGDVTEPRTLEPLRGLPGALAVVRGNCDSHPWPQQLILSRSGYRFQLQHLPPRSCAEPVAAILYGHLHQPLQDVWQGVRILNPGAITGPRNGSSSSFAWIEFQHSGWSWEIESL